MGDNGDDYLRLKFSKGKLEDTIAVSYKREHMRKPYKTKEGSFVEVLDDVLKELRENGYSNPEWRVSHAIPQPEQGLIKEILKFYRTAWVYEGI